MIEAGSALLIRGPKSWPDKIFLFAATQAPLDAVFRRAAVW